MRSLHVTPQQRRGPSSSGSADGGLSVPNVLGQTGLSLDGSSAAWRRSAPWRPREPAARSSHRSNRQVTSRAARFSKRCCKLSRCSLTHCERAGAGTELCGDSSGHRIAMPENACAVPLCKWLCLSLSESFNSPDSSDAETARAGFYFGADPVQRRACLRRMARARLLRVLPSDTGSQRLVSGAFAVAKDHRDRFIGDRRRQDQKERLIHRACLPYAPRLKRILLKNGYSLRLNLRNVCDCFYLFQVDDKRLKRQVIGPNMPEDWFADLDNESKDFLPTSAFKPWLNSDLTTPPDEPNHVPGYVQVAIAGIMMVDKNAVAALQNAHRRLLSLLLPGTPFRASKSSGTCTSMTLQ